MVMQATLVNLIEQVNRLEALSRFAQKFIVKKRTSGRLALLNGGAIFPEALFMVKNSSLRPLRNRLHRAWDQSHGWRIGKEARGWVHDHVGWEID